MTLANLEALDRSLSVLPNVGVCAELRAAITTTLEQDRIAQERLGQAELARQQAEREQRRSELRASISGLESQLVAAHKAALYFVIEWLDGFKLSKDEEKFLDMLSPSTGDLSLIRQHTKTFVFPSTCSDRIQRLRQRLSNARNELAALDT